MQKRQQHTNYFKRLLDANDSASIKRFILLISIAIFTATAINAQFFMKTTFANRELVSDITEDCFKIIAVCVLGVGAEYIGKAWVERSKAQAAADILSPGDMTTQVDTVQGDMNGPNDTSKKTTKKVDSKLTKLKSNLAKNLSDEVE